jgi:hypothetical protein
VTTESLRCRRKQAFSIVLATLLIFGSAARAQDSENASTPLTIASQGSFFVGGESRSLPPPPADATGVAAAFAGG